MFQPNPKHTRSPAHLEQTGQPSPLTKKKKKKKNKSTLNFGPTEIKLNSKLPLDPKTSQNHTSTPEILQVTFQHLNFINYIITL